MILVETDAEAWPATHDWAALAERAARAAIARSPHAALLDAPVRAELSVKFASDAEAHALNRAYRGKDRATNVLSFPMLDAEGLVSIDLDAGELLLGDIVLADGVCAAEAAEQRVTIAAHATHLVVHGTLHLLGHDHMDDAEAQAMEAAERAALASLGIDDPYADPRPEAAA